MIITYFVIFIQFNVFYNYCKRYTLQMLFCKRYHFIISYSRWKGKHSLNVFYLRWFGIFLLESSNEQRSPRKNFDRRPGQVCLHLFWSSLGIQALFLTLLPHFSKPHAHFWREDINLIFCSHIHNDWKGYSFDLGYFWSSIKLMIDIRVHLVY